MFSLGSYDTQAIILPERAERKGAHALQRMDGSYRMEPCGKKPKNNASLSFLNNASKLTCAYQRQARQLSEALIKNENRMNQAMGETMSQDFRAQEPSPFI